MNQNRYSLAYRTAEVQQVMNWIKARQSGYVLGLRGAGKSNFLRFLLRKATQRRYLGQACTDFLFILVNLLSLTEHTEWAVYELILARLVDQVQSLGEDQRTVEEIILLHQEVMRVRNLLVAQRAVERCVSALCEPPTRHLVLFLDEFDAVFRDLSPSLFRCLRALRDNHKDQISYIAITFGELPSLRDDISEVEHFCRLVGRNVCYLGPYSEEDSRQMVRYLASQRSVVISEQDVAHLIEFSGGHAGLLKATLSTLWGRCRAGIATETASTLGGEPAVQTECRKVWEGLTEGEQIALCGLARDEWVGTDTLVHLEQRGLTRRRGTRQALFSPVFADFVRQHGSPPMEGTIIRRSPRIVQIDGRRLEGLTELEFEMLCYLYEHRGQVCTKDELIANVYRQQYHRMKGGVTDEALQALVSRLRAKVEPPRHIVTVRGEGYKFVEPDE